MTLKDLILGRFRVSRSSAAVASPRGLTDASHGEGDSSAWWLNDGRASMAMAVATVYRCIKFLTDSVANLPINEKRLNGAIYTIHNSTLSYLLNVAPNEYTNAFDFLSQLIYDYLCNGNAYIAPIYDYKTGELSKLYLVKPEAVTYDRKKNAYKVANSEPGHGTYKASDFIHIKNFTSPEDRHTGLGVLAYARMTTSLCSVADAETLRRFREGGDIKGILGNDRTLKQGWGKNTEAQLENASLDIDEKFRKGAHIVHVPGFTEFRQLTMTSADMQWMESRRFAVRDICRFFGVHPSFVFDDTSNNYKSAEMANAAFLSNTLNPILRKIETEFTRVLIPKEYQRYRKIEFDRSGIYACDLEARARYQSAMLGSGIATVNELRISEDREPVANGDTPLVSANLKPLTELSNENEANNN